jgi:hypothetical protein
MSALAAIVRCSPQPHARFIVTTSPQTSRWAAHTLERTAPLEFSAVQTLIELAIEPRHLTAQVKLAASSTLPLPL